MGRDYDPLSNDLGTILDFLAYLQATGKSYNTINIHRSMLSGTLAPIETGPVGQHPLVIRLLKGCYNKNPPRPKYEAIWSVETVLNFMRNQGPNNLLNFASLSKKLATLLAISTWLRTAELASLDATSITDCSAGVRIALSKPRKTQKTGSLRSVALESFPEKTICPVDCLKTYIYLRLFKNGL